MKRVPRFLSVLLVVCIILSMMPSVFAAGEDTVEFAFLVTSDLHGQIYATDYTVDASKSGTYKRGLTRISSYIKEMQSEYGDNLYTIDMGDTIQGAPLTYYYAFNKPEDDPPAIKAFRSIGYDMWIVGNHEFNYGLDILNRQLDYATSESTEDEKQLTVCMANYLDSTTNSNEAKDWKTWKGYDPYVIKDFDGVKVAIIAFGNPNVPKWDIPANWEGIYFADIIETYKHYEPEMKEKADMIVVAAHSGVNSDEGSDYIERLIQQTDSISFAFSGHEHNNQIWEIENAKGDKIPVLQPYTKARSIAQVTVSYDKTTNTATIEPELKDMENYPLDEELVSILQPYEKATWEEYMLEKIGTASDDFSAADLGTAPSAFMDLINTVQLWGAYDRTGENTPDDKTDDTMAQLSISAPLTSGDNANIIDKGDIYLGDMFKLYRFENWFYQITMNGEEIHQWLEFAATKINTDENGKPYVTTGDLTYYDVIYGDGFSYTINYMAQPGSRITSMTYNGEEVKADQTFTVVVNNYRYNGGGNYVKWLNDHGCEFLANDPDRVIYSTQFDMIQGEDKGQARNLLTDYIRTEGTITPTITSTWKLEAVSPFKDVTEGDWFYNYVLEMTRQGIIKGITADTFAPKDNLTRGQWAVLLYRIAGSPEVTEPSGFTDVKAGSYYADAVAWASAEGIVKGVTESTFAPNSKVTREQMVAMLYRYAKAEKGTGDLSQFKDADKISNYAVEPMKWAVGEGYVNGVGNGMLSPKGLSTRAEAAKLLCVFLAE